MEQKLPYWIAGHTVCLITEKPDAVSRLLPGFGLFTQILADHSPDLNIDIRLDIGNLHIVRDPEDSIQIHTFEIDGGVCRFRRKENNYFFTIEEPGGQYIIECIMQLGSPGFHCYVEQKLVRPHHLKFTIWMCVAFWGIPRHFSPVHSSVIVYNGSAVLFLGESGTGKSTHTGLWLQHIPDSFLLNDDSPVLSVRDPVPFVYGSPWSGKGNKYVNEKYPVAAVVRIKQHQVNSIDKLSKIRAFGALYPSFPPAFLKDVFFEDHLCQMISRILTTVRVYLLACLPDKAAAILVKNTVYEPVKCNQ